jgi:hypothetical protein
MTCLIQFSWALVHNDGPVELHAIKRNVKILRDGLSDYFFEVPMAKDQLEFYKVFFHLLYSSKITTV